MGINGLITKQTTHHLI